MWRDQLVDRIRSPRAGCVGANGWWCLQQWRRQLPQALDALGGRKQSVIAAERIVDQPLVRLEHIAGPVGFVEGELQAQLVQFHARARPLAVEAERQLRRIGEVERQVVGPVGADSRASRRA